MSQLILSLSLVSWHSIQRAHLHLELVSYASLQFTTRRQSCTSTSPSEGITAALQGVVEVDLSLLKQVLFSCLSMAEFHWANGHTQYLVAVVIQLACQVISVPSHVSFGLLHVNLAL